MVLLSLDEEERPPPLVDVPGMQRSVSMVQVTQMKRSASKHLRPMSRSRSSAALPPITSAPRLSATAEPSTRRASIESTPMQDSVRVSATADPSTRRVSIQSSQSAANQPPRRPHPAMLKRQHTGIGTAPSFSRSVVHIDAQIMNPDEIAAQAQAEAAQAAEGGSKGGRVATPTSFSIFDSFDMKTL